MKTAMNQTDILKQRLTEQTQLHADHFTPLATLLVLTVGYAIIYLQQKPPALLQEYMPILQGLLLLQAAILAWVGFARWIKPEKNRIAGEVFSYGNIVFLGICLLLAIKLNIFQKLLALPFLIIYLCATVRIVRLHRLVKALYGPMTKQTREQASPCPRSFHVLNFHKTLALLPFLLGLLFYGAFKLLTEGGTAWGAFVIGFAVPLPFVLLLSLPAFLIKQTGSPSIAQKVIRKITIFLLQRRNEFPLEELPAFRWWLSHTGWNWPENFAELAPLIDTDSFDWHNPNEWQKPLQNAREQLARQKEPLVIGSKANETVAPVIPVRLPPTSKITPLMAAVIHNDIQQLKELLPSAEINRAYAGNGNTPLHVAAWNGYTETARLLLAQTGIDKEARNLAGKTPLDLAAEQNHQHIINLLKNNPS